MLKKFQKHNKRKDFDPFSAMEMELRDCSMNFDLKDLDKTFQQSRDFRVLDVTYSAKDVTKNFSSELLSKLSELRGNEWYPIVLIIYNSDKSIHKALGLEFSPVERSLSIAEFAGRFRDWIDNCFFHYGSVIIGGVECNISEDTDVGNEPITFRIFFRLTSQEYLELLNCLDSVSFFNDCSLANLSVGTFYMVTTRTTTKWNVCFLKKIRIGGFLVAFTSGAGVSI